MIDRDVLRLLCFGFDGTVVPDYVRDLLAQGLGGVILFKRNLRDLEQICALTTELHRHAFGPLLVGVDQEGGRVTRLPPPFLIPPPAAVLGQAADPHLTLETARAVGRELRAAGFNWNLAPVLDVHTNPDNPIIGDRAFGSDPQRVARLGVLALRGFEEAGVLATGKHFPGHGDTAADSHLTLPESTQTGLRWRAVEFLPFQEAIRADIPGILVAHLRCPALDPTVPSSLSRRIITDLLRDELGFGGVVVCDDLEMGAIAAHEDVGEAAVRFLDAGGDLVLVCRDSDKQQAVLRAVQAACKTGRLSEARIGASLRRIGTFLDRVPRLDAARIVEVARSVVGDPAHRDLLDRIARGSLT